MNKEVIRSLLEALKNNDISIDEVISSLQTIQYADLGFAKIDNDRQRRTGYPEVILCEGKTNEQIAIIAKNMDENGSNVLATRATKEAYETILNLCPAARYNELARTVSIINDPPATTKTYIAIVTAGTSDLSVAEEASETAKILGSKVKLIADVGVAGIHRLIDNIDIIRKARVVIVVAGMEGALASIVGGLVSIPVVAVPTSVGYGTHLKGFTPLFAMLSSCSAGIAVVNIDNGFGAGYFAHLINSI